MREASELDAHLRFPPLPPPLLVHTMPRIDLCTSSSHADEIAVMRRMGLPETFALTDYTKLKG